MFTGITSRVGQEVPVWNEEFDSGSIPDERIWSYDLGDGGWGNRELQTYTCQPENLRVEGSHLIITAARSGAGFTSARIRTEGKLTVQYGIVEARIQVPDLGDGLWPAFWLLGCSFPDIGWPACGEMIVMEMGVGGAFEAGLAGRRIMSAAHWQKRSVHETGSAVLDHPLDLVGSFHRYRLEWTPDMIHTFVDEMPIWRMDISDIPQFHRPHFLLLNLAVGGVHTGICEAAGITAPFPAEYRVDYIRIFDNGFTKLGGTAFHEEQKEKARC